MNKKGKGERNLLELDLAPAICQTVACSSCLSINYKWLRVSRSADLLLLKRIEQFPLY